MNSVARRVGRAKDSLLYTALLSGLQTPDWIDAALQLI
jgi:hypothetical protein